MKSRHLIIILLAIASLCGCSNNPEQENHIRLQFHDKVFRIAQFTDIHWAHNEVEANSQKAEMILQVINEQKPDLCILTGDIVTDEPGMQGLDEIVSLFEKAGVPFAYLCGNHDVECMDADSIYNRLEKSPLSMAEKGPEGIHNIGNYILPVYSENGEEAALLYCINSGNHSDNREHSDYDWIRPEQTQYYVQRSKEYTRKNNGQPLPALAFFHICLPEYVTMRENGDYEGAFGEDECPGDINGGFFGAAYENGDIMGMFVGHDHANDYVGLHKGIMLAYGRQSGVSLNNNEACPMGARIIEIHEGKREFETWIATPAGCEWTYYYPMGISSHDEETMTLHKALDIKPLEKGVNYEYFEGPIHLTSEIEKYGTKKASGTMPEISINSAPAEDHFAYRFRTYMEVPETTIYRLKVYSDDGAVLYVDGEKVVDNDGGHSAQNATGLVRLEKGFHLLEVDYFENYMGQTLELGIASRFMPQQKLSGEMLWRI